MGGDQFITEYVHPQSEVAFKTDKCSDIAYSPKKHCCGVCSHIFIRS